mmetsp:Transcript_5360/g.12882  ORF Transcript_5360/g.12882 Transcript_5360/m.12882 type:complete len:407 (+) Transcript_5360:332-1552(+)
MNEARRERVPCPSGVHGWHRKRVHHAPVALKRVGDAGRAVCDEHTHALWAHRLEYLVRPLHRLVAVNSKEKLNLISSRLEYGGTPNVPKNLLPGVLVPIPENRAVVHIRHPQDVEVLADVADRHHGLSRGRKREPEGACDDPRRRVKECPIYALEVRRAVCEPVVCSGEAGKLPLAQLVPGHIHVPRLPLLVPLHAHRGELARLERPQDAVPVRVGPHAADKGRGCPQLGERARDVDRGPPGVRRPLVRLVAKFDGLVGRNLINQSLPVRHHLRGTHGVRRRVPAQALVDQPVAPFNVADVYGAERPGAVLPTPREPLLDRLLELLLGGPLPVHYDPRVFVEHPCVLGQVCHRRPVVPVQLLLLGRFVARQPLCRVPALHTQPHDPPPGPGAGHAEERARGGEVGD